MRREIAMYRAFSKLDLPVRVPRMLAANAERGFIVLERIDGEPLARRRHVVPTDRRTWRR
jgi:aminoglycoside phosphotransferase (APT) family kinase protein